MIEHVGRRIRIPGATAHPSAARVARAAKNHVMGLEDARCRTRFLLRDRDGRFPALFDALLAAAGIEVVFGGVRVPRMNSIMERWVRACRRELLERALICNRRHLLHAVRAFEQCYHSPRPHRGIADARPLYPWPTPITDPDEITRLGIRRRDRLGGILHEYRHAA